jgi:protein SCO1/2
MSRAPRILLAVLLGATAAASGAWLAARMAEPQAPVNARILNTPRPVPSVLMTAHDGSRFGPEDFEGRWTFVFFGFTHCPDVCPTTLQTLNGTVRALADLPEGLQPEVVLVSVDPGRDTPDQLAGYVPFFNPDFRGVWVPTEHLSELTRAFGAAFAYVPAGEDGYTVDHTASIFLVGPDARITAVFTTPHTAEGVARDYRRVLQAREAG